MQEIFFCRVLDIRVTQIVEPHAPKSPVSSVPMTNTYRFFGNVTRILTPDNLKTGAIKNTKDETVVNKSCQEMAEYYGTAIIPARPPKPRDKAFEEGSVGVVSTWLLATLRNQQFPSLKELKLAIQEKLTAFRVYLKTQTSYINCTKSKNAVE